jgi:leucyl-tRNA synthetase
MSKPTTSRSADPNEATPSERAPFRYTARLADGIETRWQAYWEKHAIFRTPNPGEDGFDGSRPKFYALDMFPYPSGAGLHVGHPEGYTATDIVSRYKRHKGFNVLHPMGWDAFGLPAEQYAIQTGIHPAITTSKAIETFRRQLKRFGFDYDWSRQFATIDEDYYKWTQWIWLKAYHAWYDTAACRARPIGDLVAALENGTLCVGPERTPVKAGEEGRPWRELTADEQRAFIDAQRLAYLDEQTVNWCPNLGTALANEEVTADGLSERGHHPVYRKPLRQWMYRITAFADRLIEDLDHIDWPESTAIMEREWIGRSEGAEVDFPLAEDLSSSPVEDNKLAALRVYTTRPDTLFGATFMVVAPEHPLIANLLTSPLPDTDVQALRAYVEAARNRAEIDRIAETKDKTGVFTGAFAINPVNDDRIPIWTADYVLMGYGHGAIMAVPAHDQRDFEFAMKFDIPIIQVIEPASDEAGTWSSDDPRQWDCAFTGDGANVNSANDEISINGLPTPEAIRKITAWLEAKRIGRFKVNYKLRDWLFSRQRYWGEPFPIVYDEQGVHYPVDESNLPVVLPPMEDYEPIASDEPMPMLAKAKDWVRITAGEAGVSPNVLPPRTPVRRETNTMPTWAGSCWYYLRYCDPKNDERFIGRDADRYWMLSPKAPGEDPKWKEGYDPQRHRFGGVDLYLGGFEYANTHLLYTRFWHKLLYDLGEVSTPEPFHTLRHQGLITSFAYQRPDKSLAPMDAVDEVAEGEFIEKATGEPVKQVVAKMSKSLKNVINPDDVIAEYGADTFRLYEMYMGPLEATKPWNTRDIIGVFRFLQRVWRLAVDEETGALTPREERDQAIERLLHRTIAKVADDIERLSLNTAIAAMIELINEAYKAGGLSADQWARFAIILAPFAPHIAEELWWKLGHANSLAYEPWPEYDESLIREEQIELPVQIMGKVRGRITVPADADQSTTEAAALNDERVAKHLEGKMVRKVIIVPGKIVNIVAE